MAEALRRAPLVRPLAAALLVGLLVVACCPVPAGSTGAATAFSATVASVDSDGYWAVSRDGARWRLTGAPPVGTGERVYLEGVWTRGETFRVDRVTALPDR